MGLNRCHPRDQSLPKSICVASPINNNLLTHHLQNPFILHVTRTINLLLMWNFKHIKWMRRYSIHGFILLCGILFPQSSLEIINRNLHWYYQYITICIVKQCIAAVGFYFWLWKFNTTRLQNILQVPETMLFNVKTSTLC